MGKYVSDFPQEGHFSVVLEGYDHRNGGIVILRARDQVKGAKVNVVMNEETALAFHDELTRILKNAGAFREQWEKDLS